MERGILTCECNKKVKEIGTSNNVPNPPLEITGLDIQEPIFPYYNDTQNTRMPNDELGRVNGEPYGQEPPHEPYLSEYYPEQQLNIMNNLSIPVPSIDTNYTATGAKPDSEPSMHGEEGHMSTNPQVRGYENQGKNDRIFDLPPQYIKETEKKMAVYIRVPAEKDFLCQAFDGKLVDLNADSFRPIPPSEDTERTNTVVNCKCYWGIIANIQPEREPEPQSRDDKTGQFRKKPEPYTETADELKVGTKIEMEHTKCPDKARKIAQDHLDEDPKYYTKLLTCVEPENKDLLDDPEYQEAVNVPPSTVSRYGKYTRTEHEHDDICASFEGKIYDLDSKQRPVPPSEGKGYTNTHPNCKCYYEPVDNPEEETKKMPIPTKLNVLTTLEKKHVHSIHRKIGQRAKDHKLHTVFQDGKLSKRTRGTNPMKETKLIRETLLELHNQFNWFTPDYLAKVSDLDKRVGGKFVLVRASAETITDHRSEGEPYRRLLKGEELMQLTRTGIGKSTDINHYGKDFEVDSIVLDAEYDPIRKESQMLVHLKDHEIIHFIETGQINEVSINAGAPRRMDTQCDTGECFVVPTGLILGELDGIAFTWVVSDPAGIVWHGKYIPKAKAGVRTTKIEII